MPSDTTPFSAVKAKLISCVSVSGDDSAIVTSNVATPTPSTLIVPIANSGSEIVMYGLVDVAVTLTSSAL